MKTIFKVFALIFSAALIISCSKEAAEENLKDNNGVNSKTHILSFGASFESETKVALAEEDNKVTLTLEGGDKVLVVSGTNSYTYVYSSESSKFEPEDNENAAAIGEDIYVYYPAGEFALSGEDVIFTMPAPAEGAANFGKIFPLAGKLTNPGSGYTVQLKASCAALKASVSGEKALTSIDLVQAGDLRTPIAEGVAYTWKWNDGEPTFTTETAATDLNTSASINTNVASGTFYFILPAGSTLGNLTVTVNLSEAHNGNAAKMSLSRSGFAPLRNQFYALSLYAGLFSGGEGTVEKPYIIANARDFKHIGEYCKNGYPEGGKDASEFLSAHYIQTADISFGTATNKGDISAYTIGSASAPFVGSYNAKPESTQYTLSNFIISGTPDGNEGVALFKAIDSATITNVSISNAEVSGGKFTAGLVGYAVGTVSVNGCSIANSEIKSDVSGYGVSGLVGGLYGGTVGNCSATDMAFACTATTESSSIFGGGIVCYINANVTVTDCTFNGATTVTRSIKLYGFGGIVGQTNNENVTVKYSHNYATIDLKTDGENTIDNVGGIIGVKSKGTLNNCSNEGIISGNASVGGIVGVNGAGNISSATNLGAIEGAYNVGGIAGNKSGNIYSFVHNKGTVTGSYNVGGIAGQQTGGATHGNLDNGPEAVVRNEATVTATGKDGSNISAVGGLIGRMTGGTLGQSGNNHRAVNIGDVVCTSGSSVGGLVGYVTNGTIRHCRSNATITGTSGYVGGAIGWMKAGTVEGCYAKGNVKASGNVGGFVGCINALTAPVYVLNCAAGANVINTRKGQNDGAAGFAGYLQSTATDKTIDISNCVVWDILVKAIAEDGSANNKVRVGGFVGVHNVNKGLQTIQNCYYRGVSEQLGYGGGDNWTDNPTKNVKAANTVIGGFGGYAKDVVKDCYSIAAFNAGGSITAASANYIQLDEDYIKGKTAIVPKAITTSDSGSIESGATKSFGELLTQVAAGKTLNSINLSEWASYTENGETYYYPAALTALGEDFYKK